MVALLIENGCHNCGSEESAWFEMEQVASSSPGSVRYISYPIIMHSTRASSFKLSAAKYLVVKRSHSCNFHGLNMNIVFENFRPCLKFQTNFLFRNVKKLESPSSWKMDVPKCWLLLLLLMCFFHIHCLLGACVNAVKNHESALHMSALKGKPDLVQLLLEFGANVNMENHWGQKASSIVPSSSPLHQILQESQGEHALSFFYNQLLMQ